MYCISIEEGGQDLCQLFYKSKESAEKKIKQLLINKLNDVMYFEEEKINIDELIKVKIIESLIRSFIKLKYDYVKDEENDVDEYYQNHKYEVSLTKVVFEDESEDDEGYDGDDDDDSTIGDFVNDLKRMIAEDESEDEDKNINLMSDDLCSDDVTWSLCKPCVRHLLQCSKCCKN